MECVRVRVYEWHGVTPSLTHAHAPSLTHPFGEKCFPRGGRVPRRGAMSCERHAVGGFLRGLRVSSGCSRPRMAPAASRGLSASARAVPPARWMAFCGLSTVCCGVSMVCWRLSTVFPGVSMVCWRLSTVCCGCSTVERAEKTIERVQETIERTEEIVERGERMAKHGLQTPGSPLPIKPEGSQGIWRGHFPPKLPGTRPGCARPATCGRLFPSPQIQNRN